MKKDISYSPTKRNCLYLQTNFLTAKLCALLVLHTFLCFSQEGKSAITVTYPTTGTVWQIPESVKLEWSIENIDAEKSTRFFLVRDEMVVQEFGSFKNNGFADGITLAKNIGSGDRYQVVGIELFPRDKYQIAKFVTPFFSIINKASDERKRKQEIAQATNTPKKERKKKEKSKKKTQAQQVVAAPKKTTGLKEEFDGRKISYTKELEFNSENITVKIWDHGRQDGDIVSIYLNGASVVTKHYLTYSKKEFQITLDPNKSNGLFLYAHNLGSAPPNTVSVEITDGTKSENIILNSDLKSCEAVMINVKK